MAGQALLCLIFVLFGLLLGPDVARNLAGSRRLLWITLAGQKAGGQVFLLAAAVLSGCPGYTEASPGFVVAWICNSALYLFDCTLICDVTAPHDFQHIVRASPEVD